MDRNVPPISLIAFDLDGTAFGPENADTCSPRLTRAFEEAHDAGIVLVAATGRPVWMLGKQLGSAPWLDWAITANGSSVVPMHGAPPGAEVIETPIPRARALKLLELYDRYGARYNAHLRDETLIQGWTPDYLPTFNPKAETEGNVGESDPLASIFASFGREHIRSVGSAVTEMRADPTRTLDKTDAIFPDEATCNEAIAELEAEGGLEIARIGSEEIEVSAAGVSKGVALETLCARLGIATSRAAAFGDSGNDLSMAGRGAVFVAMGNASPEVKAAADEVCGAVTDDGAAIWIEEHVLGC